MYVKKNQIRKAGRYGPLNMFHVDYLHSGSLSSTEKIDDKIAKLIQPSQQKHINVTFAVHLSHAVAELALSLIHI